MGKDKKTVEYKKYFTINLENDECYVMLIGGNFNKCRIRKGCLYKGLIKLGKIHSIGWL